MSAQFKKSDVEYAAERVPLRAGGSMTIRGATQASTLDQDLYSRRQNFSVESQMGAAVIHERKVQDLQTYIGRTSMKQKDMDDSEPQKLSVAISSGEEKTQGATTPSRVEISQRKMGKLANENTRLRIEVKALQNERDATRDGLDKMVSDLITTQTEVKEKKDEMARKDTELLELQQTVNRLSAELKENVTVLENKTEVSNLQQIISKLRAELEQKEEQLRKKDAALIEQETSFQAKLRDSKEELESRMKKQHDSAQAEIANHQTQCQKAEAQLKKLQSTQHSASQEQDERLRLASSQAAAAQTQAEVAKRQAEQHLQELEHLRASLANSTSQTSKGETERGAETDSQASALRELEAAHAAKLAELHRVSDFFKNNSERLSRQTRALMVANRSLEEGMRAKEREVKELMALVNALRV